MQKTINAQAQRGSSRHQTSAPTDATQRTPRIPPRPQRRRSPAFLCANLRGLCV